MQPSSARRIVGWYELAGGLLGMTVTLIFGPGLLDRIPAQHRAQTVTVLVISAALFALLALAGGLVLRRHRLARPLSVAMQIAQMPMWNLFGTSWAFTAGPSFTPTLSQAGVGLLLGFNVRWAIQIRDAVGPAWVGLNFVPIAVLLLLREMSREPGQGAIAHADALPEDRETPAVPSAAPPA